MAQLLDAARRVLAARAPLVAEASNVVLLLRLRVDAPKSRDIDPVRALTLVVTVAEILGEAGRANLEMVIHQVVPQLAAVVAETVREAIRNRVEQDERRRDRGRAEKDDAR